MRYQDKDVRLCGEWENTTARFAAYTAAGEEAMGGVALQKGLAPDGRPYGVLRFDFAPAYNKQRWFEAVLRIAEAHFFRDFDLQLLLSPVDPETDQEKIAALVSYGYDPDRESITAEPDMFVLEGA